MPVAWQITLTDASEVRSLKLSIKAILHMAWAICTFFKSTVHIFLNNMLNFRCLLLLFCCFYCYFRLLNLCL